ncbi:MAG: DUF533 domain-containing protein, partial [Paracoccaceae bacterium]
VAKGVSSLARGAAAGGTSRPAGTSRSGGSMAGGSGSITDMLGGMMGGTQGGAGGLGDLLGGLAGGTSRGGAAGGGLGDLLGGLAGGTAARGGSGGGLADILGSLAGGAGAGGGGNPLDTLGQMMGGSQGGLPGGLGGLLDSLGGAAAAGGAAGGLGGLLNQALQKGAPQETPTVAQEQQAALLLRAMIQAAKSDGRIDQAEKEALTAHLGDVTAEEARIVEASFHAPVDVDALANDTPKGMEQQVYMMSLLGLDLDSQAEAQYLHALAQKLGIDPKTANAIHQKMGEPALYS